MTTTALTGTTPALRRRILPRPRRRPGPRDATGMVTAYAATLFLIPSALVLGPLGAAGSPSALCGMLCLLLWTVLRMLPSNGPARGLQPVRIALGIYATALLMSYAWGTLHPLGGEELSGADRGLLSLASWSGIALVGADLLQSRESVERVLRMVVTCGAVMAGIAMIQFSTGIDLAGYIRIPGLSVNGVPQTIQTGGALRRVTGTASHPIEFGMVLALILPFALHYAIAEKRRRKLWWGMTIVIAMVLPTSLSRSAIVALVVELLVLFMRWEPKRRAAAIAVAPLFIVGLRITSPGLVGTIFNMFAGASDDDSLQGRADSRGAVGHLIDQSPWLGRGFNTYIPANYLDYGLVGVNHGSLDNQYLGSLIETGWIGTIALLLVFIIGAAMARGIRLRAGDRDTAELGQAFLASFLATAFGMATFDGIGFPMFIGTFYLLFGLAGTLWRITRAEWNAAHLGPATTPRAGRARLTDPAMSTSPV